VQDVEAVARANTKHLGLNVHSRVNRPSPEQSSDPPGRSQARWEGSSVLLCDPLAELLPSIGRLAKTSGGNLPVRELTESS
jgi:hypothetical protein